MKSRSLFLAFALAIMLCGVAFGAAPTCASCATTAQNLALPPGMLGLSTSPSVAVNFNLVFNNGYDYVYPTEFTAIFSGLGSGYAVTNGISYAAWCADMNASFAAIEDYTFYSSYDTAHIPANAQSANWDKVNWLLNHKPQPMGNTYAEQLFYIGITQEVIYKLLDGQYHLTDESPQLNYLGFGNWQPIADAIYNTAIVSGAGFVPSAGQTIAVLGYVDGFDQGYGGTNVYQDILLEVPMPPCGSAGAIGDFVWNDLNSNGVQDANEPGINGVTVNLLDTTGDTLATAITGPAPNGYSYLPPGSQGYYQFSGICPGNYVVVVPLPQPALSGFVPTLSNVGGSSATNNSKGSPANVTLTTSNPIDEAVDFGYTGPSQVTIQCAANSTGEVGSPVDIQITATGGVTPYTFSIASGSLPTGLSLNSGTGLISGTPMAAGSFTVKVTDSQGHSSSGSCPITITSGPVIQCSANSTGEVGLPVSIQISATGGTQPYTFSIASGSLPSGLSLNSSTGLITGTPTAAGSFTVKVTDANGQMSTGTCPITITSGPVIQCSANSTGEVGVPVSIQISAIGGTQPYTFSIASGSLPSGLSLNSSTGLITGTPSTTGSFTVKVTDANGQMSTGTCPITITSGPAIQCSANSTGEVGVPVSIQISAIGGTQPYTFSIASGSLPGGLSLNSSTGLITGTPTAAGSFTVKVTDANGQMSTGTCPITITSGPAIQCSANSTGEVGVPVSIQISAIGGTQPYTFSIASGSLPSGLSLNSSTGLISGTPNAAGSFTVKVTDANGQMSTGTCPITITSGPAIQCSANSTGEVGVPVSIQISAIGGTQPYTFSIASGSLPSGLSLNSSTGLITGTATAAGSFTVKVTDAKGQMSTGTCPVTIISGPAIQCSANSTGQVGVPVNIQISATGGTQPYTFSIASGSLPSGLSLNSSTGLITGTPTAAGSFTVKVTDANGQMSTGTCPITITSVPPIISNCVSISAIAGSPIAPVTLTATGGVGAPYTFTATGLPPGLSISTSGTISGTPTVSGTFNYTVTITDVAGNRGTLNCTVIVTTCLLGQLGPAGAFSILGLQNANIQLSSGPLQVNGNVGIGVNGLVHLSGGATLQSTLYADPSATVQIDGGSAFAGGVVPEPFAGIQSAALAESLAAAALTPTQTFSQIQNGITITGNGGQNVIAVNGQLHLSGGQNLVISGGSTDTFIFNIAQGFQLDGGASVVLNGVLPNQVLFNFPGSGQQVQTSGNADTAGIFLAPTENIQINGGVHNSVFISGGQLSFQSNPVVNKIAACTPVGPGPLMLACPANSAVVGTPYNSALTATGGVSPYAFSITSGNLPPVTTLNGSTGGITGTPTTAGLYSFTGGVVDSNGSTATAVCSINVTTTPPYACVIPPSGTAIGGNGTSWNQFNTKGVAAAVVWINAHIGTPSGISTSTITTVDFTGVTFVLNGITYNLPNGRLVFDPSAPTTPSTTFDSTFAPYGRWVTTLNPNNLSDEIFFDGNAIPVDRNISGRGTANLNYTTNSTDNNLKFSWQWSAAVYTYWPGNNQAEILPYHQSLHAGTPLNTQVQQSLVQGPRGGGGSNFTGSWSGTGQGACPGS